MIDRKGMAFAFGSPTLAQKLSRRLWLGGVSFAVAVLVLLGVGYIVFWQTDQAYSQIIDQHGLAQDLVISLNDAVIREVLDTRAFLLTGAESSATHRQLTQAAFERVAERLHSEAHNLSPSAIFALADLEALQTEYAAFAEQMISLRRAGDAEAALRLFNERSDPLVLGLLDARQALRATLQDELREANQAYSDRTRQVAGTLGLVAVALLVAGAWLLAQLTGPHLSALGYFEHGLIETVRSRGLKPVRLPETLAGQPGSLYEAYNQLVEQLRENEAARSEIIAHVAHDLRSPLAVISGYAGLLADESSPTSPEDARQYLQAIGRQAQRVERVVDQMLTADRIETGQLEVRLAPMHLGGLLRELTAEMAEASGRTIVLDSGAAPDLVLGDALRLRDLFGNLLDNAVKFSPAGTPVSVRLGAGDEPARVEVTITDHGPGITPADMPRLFKRFGRLASTASVTTGSGLGLYIARHVAASHQATITLESEPGQGTTARVSLPLATAGDEANREAA